MEKTLWVIPDIEKRKIEDQECDTEIMTSGTKRYKRDDIRNFMQGVDSKEEPAVSQADQ